MFEGSDAVGLGMDDEKEKEKEDSIVCMHQTSPPTVEPPIFCHRHRVLKVNRRQARKAPPSL